MKASKNIFKKFSRVFSCIWHLYPSFLFVGILDAILTATFPYVVVFYSALIIDGITAGKAANEIMIYVYEMISIDLVIGILMAYLNMKIEAMQRRINILIAQKIASKSQSLSYAQLEDQETLHLIQAARDGSNSSGGLTSFIYYIDHIIQGVLSVLYSIIMMRGLFASGTPNKQDAFADFLNNPWSSLLVFGVVLFSVIITIPLMSVINKVSYKAMQDNVEGNREYGYFYTLGSNYQYGKDIRLFHLRPLILGLQDGKRFGVNKIWNRFSFFEAGYQIVLALFDALSSFVAYGFLGLKALYGLLSVGNALAYAGAIFLLGSGLKKIGESFVNQVLIANYLQNYFIYLALPDDLSYGTEKLDESKPLSIAFNHISFTYPHQKEKALDDVSLVITPGEKLAIVGANGAGKTTLMKLICRFYEPDSGEILLNDKPLKSYDEQSCYRLYSIVFQDFKLFSYSLKENVASNDSVDEEKVVASLKKAGIYERAMAFPQGLDTVLLNKNDENGVELSGGEAQKIAIARALYKDSPLVILDEPTSALDPKSEADIYERFGTLVEKKTSVFISHRMSSTKFCDEIAVIDKGRLIEYGNHDELIKLNGIYKKMWDAQAQYYR